MTTPATIKINSKAVSQNQALSRSTLVINVILTALAAGFLLLYIVLANGQAANKYRITSLSNELTYYSDLNNSLVTQKTETEDTGSIVQYAQRLQMVEAKNISYVFENGNVALGK